MPSFAAYKNVRTITSSSQRPNTRPANCRRNNCTKSSFGPDATFRVYSGCGNGGFGNRAA